MSKSLVIAEKPSVAQDIARALGDAKRTGNYFENDTYVITSAIGHLVEIYNPKEETEKHGKLRLGNGGKWSFGSLPALPEFGLRPSRSKGAVERVNIIKRLAKRKDVSCIINACDAGREGELIFHYIANYLKESNPKFNDASVRRLWLQSMTHQAILEGLKNLRDNTDLILLREAAVARSEADWFIGINATRALSALNSKDGGFQLTTAGRVQTPTLALLVDRERQRREHHQRKYWMLEVDFQLATGSYTGKWNKQAKDPADPEDKLDRIWNQQQAEQLYQMCLTQPAGSVCETVKERKIRPPLLFDLTELQREANKRFSLPARRTLGAAQALYEKYKLLTYPRTESHHLPHDYVAVCEQTLTKFASGKTSGPQRDYLDMDLIAQHAAPARKLVATVGKRVFDTSKVSDHFAIIPTGELPRATLPDIEQKIFDLVCRRFVSAFLPTAIMQDTIRTTTLKEEQFRTIGQVIIEPGWLAVGRSSTKDKVLPPLFPAGEKSINQPSAQAEAAHLQENDTKPPARYDDASLLGAMQKAADFVEEAELSEALKAGGGLGTPATRASVIEELLRTGYTARNQKELIPTAKAFSLMEVLTDMEISELTKPDLTAEWENRLRDIEAGSVNKEDFLASIQEMAKRIVAVASKHDPDAVDGDYVTLTGNCPKCQGVVKEGYRKYSCQDCGLYFWKTVAGYQLTPAEAEILLRDRRLGPLAEFKSKLGNFFTATLILSDEGKIDMEFPDQEDDDFDPSELEGQDPIGPCPKCNKKDAQLFQATTAYRCSSVLAGKDCGFRISRLICKRELSPAEVCQLIDPERKKTDLLEGFISKYDKPFNAFLKLDPKSKKLGFEFEKRKPAAKKKAAKKKTAAQKKAAQKKSAKGKQGDRTGKRTTNSSTLN